MTTSTTKSIVFITGAFLGNNCWNEWKVYFESKGYQCIAPAWPEKEASTEELRNRHPDPAIASNRLEILTDYFAAIANALPVQPILIGHSLGGLIVQLLLQRGVGEAGVAIHSFPPQGIFNFSWLKAMWSALGIFTPVHQTYMISFTKWKQVIANGMTCQEQKQSFYKYAIPESKQVIRDTFSSDAKIKFNRPHAPLLLISGSHDQMIPPSLNYANYKKYKMGNSITDYREFKGRNQLVFDEPVWKEEADFILYWLQGMQ